MSCGQKWAAEQEEDRRYEARQKQHQKIVENFDLHKVEEIMSAIGSSLNSYDEAGVPSMALTERQRNSLNAIKLQITKIDTILKREPCNKKN